MALRRSSGAWASDGARTLLRLLLTLVLGVLVFPVTAGRLIVLTVALAGLWVARRRTDQRQGSSWPRWQSLAVALASLIGMGYLLLSPVYMMGVTTYVVSGGQPFWLAPIWLERTFTIPNIRGLRVSLVYNPIRQWLLPVVSAMSRGGTRILVEQQYGETRYLQLPLRHAFYLRGTAYAPGSASDLMLVPSPVVGIAVDFSGEYPLRSNSKSAALSIGLNSTFGPLVRVALREPAGMPAWHSVPIRGDAVVPSATYAAMLDWGIDQAASGDAMSALVSLGSAGRLAPTVGERLRANALLLVLLRDCLTGNLGSLQALPLANDSYREIMAWHWPSPCTEAEAWAIRRIADVYEEYPGVFSARLNQLRSRCPPAEGEPVKSSGTDSRLRNVDEFAIAVEAYSLRSTAALRDSARTAATNGSAAIERFASIAVASIGERIFIRNDLEWTEAIEQLHAIEQAVVAMPEPARRGYRRSIAALTALYRSFSVAGADSTTVARAMTNMAAQTAILLADSGLRRLSALFDAIASPDTTMMADALSRNVPAALTGEEWWTADYLDYQCAHAMRFVHSVSESGRSPADIDWPERLSEYGAAFSDRRARGTVIPTLVLARMTEGAEDSASVGVHEVLHAKLTHVLEAPYEELIRVSVESMRGRHMEAVAPTARGDRLQLRRDTLRVPSVGPR